MKTPWTVILERSSLIIGEPGGERADIYVGLMKVGETELGLYEQAKSAVRAAKKEALKTDRAQYQSDPSDWQMRPELHHYALLFVFPGHPPEPYYFGWQAGMDDE